MDGNVPAREPLHHHHHTTHRTHKSHRLPTLSHNARFSSQAAAAAVPCGGGATPNAADPERGESSDGR
ncbi:hypothetical protein E2C01_097444 [Portunus trituberculatus]|uniref:Uncharacterized protein n=1 Tax=Portunus trituberculatus TaxID=210409 RepID=A0A5B7K4U7_PORTR|nr:hypothetical protein [Portunus trituberculatus]